MPKAIDRFVALEGQTGKVLADVGAATSEIKQNPQSLIFGRKSKAGSETSPQAAAKEKAAKRQGKG